MKDNNIKKVVRDSYAKVAKQNSSCCGENSKVQDIGKKIGPEFLIFSFLTKD